MANREGTIEERIANILAFLDSAEGRGYIYNQEYKDFRAYNASVVLEKAFNDVRALYFQSEDRNRDRSLNYDDYLVLHKIGPDIHTIKGYRKILAKTLKKHAALADLYQPYDEGRKLLPGQSEEWERNWAARNVADYAARTRALEAYEQALDVWEPICARTEALKLTIRMGRKPSEDTNKTPERTLDHTGTCACGQNIKRESNGKLYHHGFTIKGGWREGSCIGVGLDPIEVSKEGYVAFRDAYQHQLTYQLSVQAQGTPSSFRHPHAYKLEDTRRITAADKDLWPHAVDIYNANLEMMIRGLTRDLAMYQKLIDEWAPRPMPDEAMAMFKANGGPRYFSACVEKDDDSHVMTFEAPYRTLVEIWVKGKATSPILEHEFARADMIKLSPP